MGKIKLVHWGQEERTTAGGGDEAGRRGRVRYGQQPSNTVTTSDRKHDETSRQASAWGRGCHAEIWAVLPQCIYITQGQFLGQQHTGRSFNDRDRGVRPAYHVAD